MPGLKPTETAIPDPMDADDINQRPLSNLPEKPIVPKVADLIRDSIQENPLGSGDGLKKQTPESSTT